MDMMRVCKPIVQLKEAGESDLQIEAALGMDPEPDYVPHQLAACDEWLAQMCRRIGRDEQMGMTYEQMRGDLGGRIEPSQVPGCGPISTKTGAGMISN